ncbi:hypothetical protein GALMADRAFT_103207 [Galerina marginata CBS 339.88]|uniref:G-protein coupled receptors family 1 profile domain-containing protein n=1 Tax=Galerina marginata (strain CBS 339.88) TaxID=685588 RepID=A0A067SS02_GALM3|nr:hypothetical protein GALMADRAFT_103207 [Galerina marginata CBS 339.88]
MSASNLTTGELPNPFTPLAFLDPTLSNQFEVSRYLYAVTLGIYLWDIAINLPNDLVLLFKHKIRLPTIVYYLSRVSALCFILVSFVFQVGRVEHCQALQIAIGVSWTTSQTLTSSLFYMRVRAVYNRNKFVSAAFFVLWIAVGGTAITVPAGIRGAHIGPTKQCINTDVPLSVESSVWLSLINDSAVFIAITYRILTFNVMEETFKGRLKAFFGRGSISHLSRSLLLGGQHYYLIALCMNVVLLVLVILPGVPAVYRGMFTIPVIAVTNLMACIVFRKIRFGHISQDGTTYTNATSNVGNMGNEISAPRFRGRFLTNDDGTYALRSGPSGMETIQVDISKSVTTDGQLEYPLSDIKSQVANQV